jgi:hypothetical protein
MSNNENVKYTSYEALDTCDDFIKEKTRISFEGNDANEDFYKGELIFHPKFGIYEVVKERFKDESAEMILVKTINDLVKDKETVIIAEHGELVRVFDRDDVDSRFTYFVYNGSEYEEFESEDVNGFIMRLSKLLQEKDNIIGEITSGA